MDDDADLLRRYVDARDDAAFGQLVGRHAAFVHAVARRLTRGDAALADDVAQATFIVLARRARHAARSASLRGWLHATTCYAAANARRASRRRTRRERAIDPAGGALDPRDVAAARDELAVLDAALAALRARDRDAIVLHHVEGRPLADVGRALRVSPEAAKKRVQRAMAKLRATLGARGLALPTAFAAWLASSGSREASAAVVPGGAGGRAFTIARKVTTMMKWKAATLPAAVASILLATGGIAIVAAQQTTPTRPLAASPAKPQAAALVATLGGGLSVELVGVSMPEDLTKWWRPNGSPLDGPPTPLATGFAGLADGQGRRGRSWRVAFRVRHAAPLSTYGLNVDVEARQTNILAVRGRFWPAPTTLPSGELVTTYVVDLDDFGRAALPRVDLRLSVPGEAWRTIDAIGVDGRNIDDPNVPGRWIEALGNAPGGSVLSPGTYVHWSRPVEVDGKAFVQAFDDLPNRDRDLVAIDADGGEHRAIDDDADLVTKTLGPGMLTTTSRGPGTYRVMDVSHSHVGGRFEVALARVARFELRMRERRAIQFSDVSLASGATSDARVGPHDPPRVVDGFAVDGPADRELTGGVAFGGESIGEALAVLGSQGGFNVEVDWPAFANVRTGPNESLTADSPVKLVTLPRASPLTAVRAVFEAAGGRDYGLVVSDDGRTIRIVLGGAITRADGRAFRPGARN